KRWRGEWGAVSGEYASIRDIWKAAAEKAGSVEPQDVLAATKEGGHAPHTFGDAGGGGEERISIASALVGTRPRVVLEDGKAVSKEYRSIPAWWEQHSALLIKHMEALGQMYYQRG